MSRDSSRDSYIVAKYLKEHGYQIIPINPFADEILEERCYRSLIDLPESIQKAIEVVDIFRPASDLPPIVKQAIQLRIRHGVPHVIWMQLGIVNDEAAEEARNAGLKVIINKCIMTEHIQLLYGYRI